MVSINWEAQAKRVDDTIDEVFGEAVQLIPVITAPMTGAVPDTSRAVKPVVGVYMTNDELRAESVPGQSTDFTDAHYGLSIQKMYLGDTKQGDHVLFLKASRESMLAEIALIGPSESGRIVLGLLKL